MLNLEYKYGNDLKTEKLGSEFTRPRLLAPCFVIARLAGILFMLSTLSCSNHTDYRGISSKSTDLTWSPYGNTFVVNTPVNLVARLTWKRGWDRSMGASVSIAFDGANANSCQVQGQNTSSHPDSSRVGFLPPRSFLFGNVTQLGADKLAEADITCVVPGMVMIYVFAAVPTNLNGTSLEDILIGQVTFLWIPQPSIGFSTSGSVVSVTEGDSGVKSVPVTFSLNFPQPQAYSVDYTTQEGTATIADADFVASFGTVHFPIGSISQTIYVSVNGDTKNELDETFDIQLSNPSGGATLGVSSTTVKILNDDMAPMIAIGASSLMEGNMGQSSMIWSATLSVSSAFDVSFDFATQDISALQGSDYLASNGTVTIPAGSLSQTFSVPVLGDSLDEFDESFLVNFTNEQGGVLSTTSVVGTIVNDDLPPTISVSDVPNIFEGDAGNTVALFVVALSSASGKSISVDFSTAGDTATPGADFLSNSGTLNFPAGMITQTIPIVIVGDTLNEIDESFSVNLANAVNASIADGQALGTILDDDVITINPPPGPELTNFIETLTGTCDSSVGFSVLPTSSGLRIISSSCVANVLTLVIGFQATYGVTEARSFSIIDANGHVLNQIVNFRRDCPTGFVGIPADALYSTPDFCVAKYEMRDSGDAVHPVSRDTGNPWDFISQPQSIAACNSSGWTLISNTQWQVIGRNLESMAENWDSGTVGTGSLFLGHSFSNPGAPCDSRYSSVSGNCSTVSPNPLHVRTLRSTNNELIWDISGNVEEWVSDPFDDAALDPIFPSAAAFPPGDMSIQYDDSNRCTSGGFPAPCFGIGTTNKFLYGPAGNYNHTHGVGKMSTWGDYATDTAAIVRGGSFPDAIGNSSSAVAGVFGVWGVTTPDYTSFYTGFRCTSP